MMGYGGGWGWHGVFGPVAMIVYAVIIAVPAWRICAKAGYPGWIGLFAVLPIANLVLLYFLAFAEWPIERERRGGDGGSAGPPQEG